MVIDDFLPWLASPEGQSSEQALFEVMDSLENCLVDPSERTIVWDDGKRLSITETARRIHLQSNLPLKQIESHVVGWLEMHYQPQGLNEQQMDQFETILLAWTQEHEDSQRGDPDQL